MACIELDRARRAGPSPRGEQRRRCPPARRCSLAPAGQPPLKLTGAAPLRLPVPRRYQPIGGCPRGIRSALWFRARCCLRATSLGRGCPLSVPLRSRMCCDCCGGSCCGAAVQKPCKIKTVGVFQFLREDGVWTAEPGPSTQRHFLDTGGRGACGIAIALINSTHTRARGSWWLIEACWRALILQTLGDRWTSYFGRVSLITDRIHARL